MAEDHRLAQPHGPEAAVVVVMQVRPADPAGGQPQPHLPRPRRSSAALLDPQVVGGMYDDRAHQITGVSQRPAREMGRQVVAHELPIARRVSTVPDRRGAGERHFGAPGTAGSAAARLRRRRAPPPRSARLPGVEKRLLVHVRPRARHWSASPGPSASSTRAFTMCRVSAVAARPTIRWSNLPPAPPRRARRSRRPSSFGARGIGDLHAEALQPPRDGLRRSARARGCPPGSPTASASADTPPFAAQSPDRTQASAPPRPARGQEHRHSQVRDIVRSAHRACSSPGCPAPRRQAGPPRR